jgi:peptide/nickel transport system substrate-binding protein
MARQSSRTYRSVARIGVGGVALALVAAACGGGGGKKTSDNTTKGGQKGGTAYVLMHNDFEFLDPSQIYVSQALDASRLITRTLTTYKAKPGKEGLQIVPDLATDTGQKNAACTQWTFHLKDGLKYEDGSPIVAGDIKYALERTFDDAIQNGPTYPKDYIEGGDTYGGPWKDPTGDLKGIEVKDSKTLVFHLKKVVCDFNYTATFPEFSPIPKAKDTKDQYANHPVSTGPYKIEKYDRGKLLTLVRNSNWDAKTDSVRTALPNRWEFDFGLAEDVIGQRLIADQGNDQAATMLDISVQAAQLPQTQAANVHSRLVQGASGFVYYVAINTQRVKNLAIRKALNTMADKAAVMQTCGGVHVCGDVANSITAPNVASYQKFDLYHGGDHGNVAAAKKILTDAHVSMPVPLTFAYRDRQDVADQFAAFQRGWEREGVFKINAKPVPSTGYFAKIGTPSSMTDADLIWADWGADWPSGSTVIPPLFDGRQIKDSGNNVLSLVNDPGINAKIDQAQKETDFNRSQQEWGDLDKTIQQQAIVVPWRYGITIELRGSRLTNAYLHPFFGNVDLITVGVKS